MIEYLPWSRRVLQEVFSFYTLSGFCILDLQLGSGCNFSCIYCDTPIRTVKSNINIDWLEKVIKNNSIKWIFICGLGEPTFGNNNLQLKSILKLCKQYDIKCSMFTNNSLIDDEIKSYIEESVLYVIFKLDTIKSKDLAKGIYGTNDLDCYFKSVSNIIDLVKVHDNCTNIAASIVLTQMNKDEIIEITEYCISNDIFPLLGNLENSGKAIDKYDSLKIKDEELTLMKYEIEKKLNLEYQIPICPSVIGGIHIDCNNNVIVDEFTGLSCHWFWLKEPMVKVIVKDVDKYQFKEIEKRLILYRDSRIDSIKQYIENLNHMPFGGCGGDVKTMLAEYLKLYNVMGFNKTMSTKLDLCPPQKKALQQHKNPAKN